ncbi:MAG TPA: hypothetical protein VGJ84_13375, partial [Polyangiaceae bacterium]
MLDPSVKGSGPAPCGVDQRAVGQLLQVGVGGTGTASGDKATTDCRFEMTAHNLHGARTGGHSIR